MKNPEHIGIIVDGNRRWAKERGLFPFQGHQKGLETVKKIIAHAQKEGIAMLTLFIFSTENWKRSKEEIKVFMGLIDQFFKNEFKNKKNPLFERIKIKVVGRRDDLSSKLKNIIKEVESSTKDNRGMILNLAFNYGGRDEIVYAMQKISEEGTSPDNITVELVQKHMMVPDLDIIIRTGKEQRISNFFIWQAAYSELFFLNKYWPEFNEKDFTAVLIDYAKRQRRFGK